jgi:hypothetical protein
MTDQAQVQVSGGGGPRLPEGAKSSWGNLSGHGATLASLADQLQDEADEALLAQLEQSIISFNTNITTLSALLQGVGGDIERQVVRVQQVAADLAIHTALLKEDHSADNVANWRVGATSLATEVSTLDSLISARVLSESGATDGVGGGGDAEVPQITVEDLRSVQLTHVEPPQTGIPDWAKEDYQGDGKLVTTDIDGVVTDEYEGARRVLIASMTPDRKIGSVYFDDGSRIRTTHSAGPAGESHGGLTNVQFNLVPDRAERAFIRDTGTPRSAPNFWRLHDEWLANYLNDTSVDDLPDWVTVVDEPEDAFDASQQNPPETLKLFEIFVSVSGEVQDWHPSRGTAVEFETNKQVISVLLAALDEINGQGDGPRLTNVADRNRVFYDFIVRRIPDFADRIRDPRRV